MYYHLYHRTFCWSTTAYSFLAVVVHFRKCLCERGLLQTVFCAQQKHRFAVHLVAAVDTGLCKTAVCLCIWCSQLSIMQVRLAANYCKRFRNGMVQTSLREKLYPGSNSTVQTMRAFSSQSNSDKMTAANVPPPPPKEFQSDFSDYSTPWANNFSSYKFDINSDKPYPIWFFDPEGETYQAILAAAKASADVIETWHQFSGMPWWATIAVCSCTPLVPYLILI